LIHLSSEGAIPTDTSTAVEVNPIYQEVHAAPDIAGSSLQIVVEASQKNAVADGVLLAHGGNVIGYSLHVEQGIPVFEVTQKKEIFRIAWPEPVKGKMRIVADLGENEMSLSVNGEPKVSATSPGLLRAQPKIGLSVGYDALSNAGSYEVPNPYNGTILSTRIDAGGTPPAVAKVMPRSEIEAGLASHDKALFIKEGWIRDPYIILGPDDYYYLTGTTPNPGEPREQSDPYNTGLGDESIVGWKAKVWRSKDLIDWEPLGTPFTMKEGIWFEKRHKRFEEVPEKLWFLWAPEVHWLGDRWALTHTSPSPVRGANLALTEGADLKGPWTHPMGAKIGHRHDPSLFEDVDGVWYLLYGNTEVAPLSDDFSELTAEPVQIDPSGSRIAPDGKEIFVIGHEGATMRKIGKKYVHMGTAWSTDTGRKGSYNLYYCTADKITGPYGERKFIGRFLGHGTPFQDKQGRWWCTAFYNGNIPPVGRKGIEKRDLSATAQTINQRGTTIVPLEVNVLDEGEIYIRANDPVYANPGPDEVQQFAK
jgi:xylan 1,4-beta-xylosidase